MVYNIIIKHILLYYMQIGGVGFSGPLRLKRSRQFYSSGAAQLYCTYTNIIPILVL